MTDRVEVYRRSDTKRDEVYIISHYAKQIDLRTGLRPPRSQLDSKSGSSLLRVIPKYANDENDKLAIEREIRELRMALDLMT